MMLSNIFGKIAALNQSGRSVGENHREEILDILRGSNLEIVAELGRTTLALQDLYYLNPGDVISLGHHKDEPIYLRIGGSPWFGGKMGVQKNNIAIKIGQVYHNEGRGDS